MKKSKNDIIKEDLKDILKKTAKGGIGGVATGAGVGAAKGASMAAKELKPYPLPIMAKAPVMAGAAAAGAVKGIKSGTAAGLGLGLGGLKGAADSIHDAAVKHKNMTMAGAGLTTAALLAAAAIAAHKHRNSPEYIKKHIESLKMAMANCGKTNNPEECKAKLKAKLEALVTKQKLVTKESKKMSKTELQSIIKEDSKIELQSALNNLVKEDFNKDNFKFASKAAGKTLIGSLGGAATGGATGLVAGGAAGAVKGAKAMSAHIKNMPLPSEAKLGLVGGGATIGAARGAAAAVRPGTTIGQILGTTAAFKSIGADMRKRALKQDGIFLGTTAALLTAAAIAAHKYHNTPGYLNKKIAIYTSALAKCGQTKNPELCKIKFKHKLEEIKEKLQAQKVKKENVQITTESLIMAAVVLSEAEKDKAKKIKIITKAMTKCGKTKNSKDCKAKFKKNLKEITQIALHK